MTLVGFTITNMVDIYSYLIRRLYHKKEEVQLS